MPNPNLIERLTYLCAVAAAVVGWSINQITQQIAETKTVAYELASPRDIGGKTETSVTLTNISATKSVQYLQVRLLYQGSCKLEKAWESVGGITLRGQLPPTKSETSIIYQFDNFGPGSIYKLTTESSKGCKGRVFAWSSDGDTRIIARNFETFLAENRFAMMVGVAGGFLAIFILTFAFSLVKGSRDEGAKNVGVRDDGAAHT